MLSYRESITYLLERGLIAPSSIVDGDLVLKDVSRRNFNLQIISRNGPSYLFKQGIGADHEVTVAHEAAIYTLLQTGGQGTFASDYLPKCHLYDPEQHVLVLAFFVDGQSWEELHVRKRRIPNRLAREMGTALSALHGVDWGSEIAGGNGRPPWVLSLHHPSIEAINSYSIANRKVIGIVQNSAELCRCLDDLRETWTSESLLHNDVKWDNCLAAEQAGRSHVCDLKLVDWELADLGDPAWDIGSFLSQFLAHWLLSVPITGEAPPERFMSLARYPIDKMQPAIKSFWDAYVLGRALKQKEAEQLLLRAVKYGAARLIQAVFEDMQEAVDLTGNSICLLQLSLNMFKRPQEATRQLLGISIGAGV